MFKKKLQTEIPEKLLRKLKNFDQVREFRKNLKMLEKITTLNVKKVRRKILVEKIHNFKKKKNRSCQKFENYKQK